MFTKSIATLAGAALVASFALTTVAEAGGCGGGYRVFKSRPSVSYAAVARAKQQARMRAIAAARQRQIAAARQARIAEARRDAAAKRAIAARTEAKRTAVAEAKSETLDETKPAEVAEAVEKTESETKPAEKTTSKVAVAAAEETCKRYIPAVGATVTVDCDQK